jgi:hypothetical protein
MPFYIVVHFSFSLCTDVTNKSRKRFLAAVPAVRAYRITGIGTIASLLAAESNPAAIARVQAGYGGGGCFFMSAMELVHLHTVQV